MAFKNLLHLLPLMVVAALILLSDISSFDALRHPAAQDCLQLCEAYFERWSGISAHSAPVGWANGYPMAGAVLRFWVPDASLALQVISWVSAGLAVWMFERLLQLWAPGTSPASRWVFTGLGLAMSPFFIKAGLSVLPDALGLLFFLAALYVGLRVLESRHHKSATWVAMWAVWAGVTQWSASVFLLPFVVAIGRRMMRRQQWGWVLAMNGVGVATLGFYCFSSSSALGFDAPSWQEWSLGNLFRRSFESSPGGLAPYLLPNGLYILAPLAHPGFCLPLSLLFLMSKKTDFHHAAQKILLLSLVLFALFVGGLPEQEMRYLLPGFTVLLLFLFPAWDRVFAYGFYFFRRLTFTILLLALAIQVVSSVYLVFSR
ncbi:MAG: hypothetical protein KF734_18670 [Saprospiraceae bacterium]|nr:hypothetical protein [Saprospiraceae bacterium]